jgi:hypothetical protein
VKAKSKLINEKYQCEKSCLKLTVNRRKWKSAYAKENVAKSVESWNEMKAGYRNNDRKYQ